MAEPKKKKTSKRKVRKTEARDPGNDRSPNAPRRLTAIDRALIERAEREAKDEKKSNPKRKTTYADVAAVNLRLATDEDEAAKLRHKLRGALQLPQAETWEQERDEPADVEDE